MPITLRLIVTWLKVCHLPFAVLAGTATKLDDYYRERWSYQTTILCKNGPVGKENYIIILKLNHYVCCATSSVYIV